MKDNPHENISEKQGLDFPITEKDLTPTFCSCVECILDAGYASIDLLRRHCKLGYFHASHIMHILEKKGIVGPHNGSLPRVVLISSEEWESQITSVTGNPYSYKRPLQGDFFKDDSSPCLERDSILVIAISAALDAGQVSASLLQSQLGIDYAQAARIIDQMEIDGLVGPYKEAQPREVLYSREQWELKDPTFSERLLESIKIEQQKAQKQWDTISRTLRFKLQVALHSFFVWFLEPIPFLLYLLFIALTVILVVQMFSFDFLLIARNIFSTTFYFIAFRSIYELFTPSKHSYKKALRRIKRKYYIRKKWGITDPSELTSTYSPTSFEMDSMDGHQFEYFCADLLRKNGFTNVEVTQASGDYGIDVLAEKEDVTYAIQCKCYSDNVGNHAVQEAQSGASFYNRMIPVVMTNSYFTAAAKETATRTHVLLWDRDKLLQMINK